MSYKIKVPPRPVESDAEAALHWLDRWAIWEAKNRRVVWPVTGVAFLFVLIGGGWWGWQLWQDRQATRLAGEAALHYPAIDAPVVGPSDETEKPSRSERCQRALPLYEEITERYSRSHVAPLARFYQANCQAELGQIETAISLYESVREVSPPDHPVVLFATARLGYLYARQEEIPMAIEQFRWLTEQPQALNRDQALFELGRLHEAQDDTEAALAVYRTVVKEYPRSPWTSEANVRVNALGGEEEPGGKVSEESPPVPEEATTPELPTPEREAP